MNIAIIVRRLNVKGGAQRQALCLARELKKMGHNAALYTFFYDKERCFSDLLDGMVVYSSNDTDHKNLSQLIESSTDVLNPHDQEAYKVAHYFKKLVRNVPSVWMMNDVPSKNFGFWKESQFNPNLQRSFAKSIYHKLYDFWDRRFIKTQEKITVLDNWNKSLVKKYFKKDAVIVRSGLDIEKFKFNEHKIRDTKNIKLLTTGIFFPHRRFEDLITAASLLQGNLSKDKSPNERSIEVQPRYNFSLDIIGDYDNDKKYHRVLVEQARLLKIEDKVNFLGKVSDEKLMEAYKTHDIFIFPNHLQTWGLAVFEAMACGIPVIVSRTAGASEILTDRENAMLVNSKTPEEIRNVVLELVSNPEFYSKISKNGQKFVEKNISWQKYAREMIDVFIKAKYG